MATEQEIFKKISDDLILDTLYDIPFCITGTVVSNINFAFRYVGIVGEGTLFQFIAEPGGWTVTLSTLQLVGRVQLFSKHAENKINNIGRRKKNNVW